MKFEDIRQEEYVIELFGVSRIICIHCNSNDALSVAMQLKEQLHQYDIIDDYTSERREVVQIRINKIMVWEDVVKYVNEAMGGG